MDTLTLKKYQRPSTKSAKPSQNKVNRPSDQFVEFFINDLPLSQQLDEFFQSKTPILSNHSGVLGWAVNPVVDIIKVRQLLRKKISDEEIRRAYPGEFDDDEFEWYLARHREELSNLAIRIYCCAECGGYDCGGMDVIVTTTDSAIVWEFEEEGKYLSFEFDKYRYFATLNAYLKALSVQTNKI